MKTIIIVLAVLALLAPVAVKAESDNAKLLCANLELQRISKEMKRMINVCAAKSSENCKKCVTGIVAWCAEDMMASCSLTLSEARNDACNLSPSEICE